MGVSPRRHSRRRGDSSPTASQAGMPARFSARDPCQGPAAPNRASTGWPTWESYLAPTAGTAARRDRHARGGPARAGPLDGRGLHLPDGGAEPAVVSLTVHDHVQLDRLTGTSAERYGGLL